MTDILAIIAFLLLKEEGKATICGFDPRSFARSWFVLSSWLAFGWLNTSNMSLLSPLPPRTKFLPDLLIHPNGISCCELEIEKLSGTA